MNVEQVNSEKEQINYRSKLETQLAFEFENNTEILVRTSSNHYHFCITSHYTIQYTQSTSSISWRILKNSSNDFFEQLHHQPGRDRWNVKWCNVNVNGSFESYRLRGAVLPYFVISARFTGTKLYKVQDIPLPMRP